MGRTMVQDELAQVQGRISVVTWAVALVAVASLFLRLPPLVVPELSRFGLPDPLVISSTTWMALVAGVLAGSGAEGLLRLHPRWRRQPSRRHWRSRWAYWALPAALGTLWVLLVPLLPSRLWTLAGILAGAGVLGLSLYALYGTVEPHGTGFRRHRLVLNVLTYGAVLALFLLVYRTGGRGLLSGGLIALIGGLLAVELLRMAATEAAPIFTHAAMVGLLLGEMTWALSYWGLSDLTGGLVLLLAFYLTVTVAQQGLQGRLTRRVLVELGVFSLLVLFLLWFFDPTFSVR